MRNNPLRNDATMLFQRGREGRENGFQPYGESNASIPFSPAREVEVHLRNPRLSAKYPLSSQGFELDSLFALQ